MREKTERDAATSQSEGGDGGLPAGGASFRSILVGAGIVLIGVLALAFVLPRLQPGPVPPTPAPTATPTSAGAAPAPAVAPSPVPSPIATVAPVATPVPATRTVMPAVATPVPATPPAPTRTPGGRSWIGDQPLPPGPIPVNGPLLQRMQDEGRPGLRTDQPGLGPELRDRLLAAMAEEDRAFAKLDDSKLGEFFTGEALEDLQQQVAKARESVGKTTSRVTRTHRVMQFVPMAAPGTYQLVDALTEKIDTVLRNQDGTYGRLIREGQEQRVCVSWLVVNEANTWKLKQSDMLNGGADGALCPPGWS